MCLLFFVNNEPEPVHTQGFGNCTDTMSNLRDMFPVTACSACINAKLFTYHKEKSGNCTLIQKDKKELHVQITCAIMRV